MTNLRQKLMVPIAAATIAFSGLVGCATRPDVRGGNDYDVSSAIDIGKIKPSKHHEHIAEIFGNLYNYAEIPALRKKALFSHKLSFKDDELYNGIVRRRSGEGGVYVLEPVTDEKGNRIDFVSIDPRYQKEEIKNPVLIKKGKNASIYCKTDEEYSRDGTETITLGGKTFIAIRKKEKGLYNFYLTPFDKDFTKRIDESNGHIQIWNMDDFYQPKHWSWKKLDEEISSIPREETKEKAKKEVENLGMPVMEDTKDINNQ